MSIAADGGRAVTRLFFPGSAVPEAEERESSLLLRAKYQLQEYFSGARETFDLPMDVHGTPFQEKVWKLLLDIPYGETRSYGELAAAAGSPGAAKAVGGACRSNPIPIFIPCHRVVGAGGRLTGFAGGLELKENLLKLEQRKEAVLCTGYAAAPGTT